MTTSHNPDLLTIAEAAGLLKVSTVTLHRWIKQGRLPAYHVGPKAIRIRRADLATVIAPAHEGRTLPLSGRQATPIQTDIRPLTVEEKQRGWEALRQSEALIARMRARRGGRPAAESWPLIREARERRSQQQR